ncbi:MAG: enoyl-ACP reductase [Thermaerobacter sp.]|nr:enoyl-ACP reductase [Thermaerobacter sp.]
MGLLTGRRALVTGVANKRSIAWAIAKALSREGAELALTYQHDRFKANLEKLLPELPPSTISLPLDVADDESLAAMAATLQAKWGHLDHLVHSIAFAKADDMAGRFADTSRDGYALAQDVSAYSLVALTRSVLPMLQAAGGGSVVTMTALGGERVMPSYNVMGVAKAALEASLRYLAWELGGDNIRVNAISAGPLRTLAAAGVRSAHTAMNQLPERSPLRRNITQEDVGDAAAFLLSDWARNITGQVLYVDAGYHIMAQ